MSRQHGRVIDSARSADLTDVGGVDLAAVVAFDCEGRESFWVVAVPLLGEPGVDHGNPSPLHEQVGPLPSWYQHRVVWVTEGTRCGAPTQSGRPCRNKRPCRWHGGDAS